MSKVCERHPSFQNRNEKLAKGVLGVFIVLRSFSVLRPGDMSKPDQSIHVLGEKIGSRCTAAR